MMRERVTHEYVVQVVQDSPTIAAAAITAGINRTHFYELMMRYPPLPTPAPMRHEGTLKEALDRASRSYLDAVMARSRSMAEAAQIIGVCRTTIYRIVTRVGTRNSINPAHKGCWHLYGL